MTIQAMQCTGKRHTGSNDAWRHGCRHPEAIAAHEKWLAERKPFSPRPAAVDERGRCVAPKHGTWQAHIVGCRCATAVEAIRMRRERKRHDDRVRRRSAAELEYAREVAAERRAVERRTGGRLLSDPRRPWRGGKMAVRRWSLFWVMRGVFLEEATMAELMVAAIRIDGTPMVDGPYRSRPINNLEIGERLGADDRQVYRLRQLRSRLRRQRTDRRLADSRWRAAIVAAAIERGARRG